VIIVVISEDGMIDLIPNLMPQIKHSDISKGIDELSKIFDSPKFDRKKFFQLRNYFDSHEFYLGQEECDKINKLRKSIEEKFDEELGSVRFLYNDLKPNKEMNESYYVQENN
jgi:hypothetical protein